MNMKRANEPQQEAAMTLTGLDIWNMGIGASPLEAGGADIVCCLVYA